MALETFPHWLRKKYVNDDRIEKLRSLIKDSSLNTVCQSAQCPNRDECFRKGRATFLILGDTCTRSCRFCAVKKGEPQKVDKGEAERIARLVKAMGLDHAIITSVTRDDLEDGGAGQFADCIDQIRKITPRISIEVLTSDLKPEELETILDKGPDVFAHNIETVPRLYKRLRPEADYKRSLGILNQAHKIRPDAVIKSGIMVGLGESEEEVLGVLADLRKTGCVSVAIGQYLRPSKKQVEVSEFIHPLVFDRFRAKALELGFAHVASGPFVRSSYM